MHDGTPGSIPRESPVILIEIDGGSPKPRRSEGHETFVDIDNEIFIDDEISNPIIEFDQGIELQVSLDKITSVT